jgi:MFS family permease
VEELMSDKASSIFQGAQAVGCILGPILGGVLNDLFKFRTTCDLMTFLCLFYALTLGFFHRKIICGGKRAHLEPLVKDKIIKFNSETNQLIELSLLKKKASYKSPKKVKDDEEIEEFPLTKIL